MAHASPGCGPASAWSFTRTEPGAAASPAELPDTLLWRPAEVPGTVAGALRAGGFGDEAIPAPDDSDFWFRADFDGSGRDTLRLDGLATIAEVWLNDERLLVSENMFVAHRLELATAPRNRLHICCRSLTAWLAAKRGRARWRPRMIQPPTLRHARTTLLGRMPGWCPPLPPVGPWRSVVIEPVRPGHPRPASLDLRTAIDGAEGVAMIAVTLDQETDTDPWLSVGAVDVTLERTGPRAFAGAARIAEVRRWWPHTHGLPHLYRARLRIGEAEIALPGLGFRTLAVDRGADGAGFALRVNDAPVFCRGACWTTPDLARLPGARADYEPLLMAARDGGMNMIRVPGTMVYETDAFFELCDELGLMVWQDAMLANFDYPGDESFRASLGAEISAIPRAHPPARQPRRVLRRQRGDAAGGDDGTEARRLDRRAAHDVDP